MGVESRDRYKHGWKECGLRRCATRMAKEFLWTVGMWEEMILDGLLLGLEEGYGIERCDTRSLFKICWCSVLGGLTPFRSFIQENYLPLS